jgi:hypothetical protein
LLVYGKGGGAWVGSSDPTITNVTTGASITPSTSNRNFGWTLGAGVEWAFSPTWSARLEYDFIGLNSQTFTIPAPGFAGLACRRSIHRLESQFPDGPLLTFTSPDVSSWAAAFPLWPARSRTMKHCAGLLNGPGWRGAALGDNGHDGRYQRMPKPPSAAEPLCQGVGARPASEATRRRLSKCRKSPSDQRMAANSGPMPLISSNIAAGAGAATCCAASSASRSASTALICSSNSSNRSSSRQTCAFR